MITALYLALVGIGMQLYWSSHGTFEGSGQPMYIALIFVCVVFDILIFRKLLF